MRKIIVSEFVSLDGVMEGPGPDDSFKYAGWTMPYANEEFMKFKLDEVLSAGALLLGRTTYEGFALAWPQRTDTAGFADKMNSMQKYVVDEITKLKQQPGKDILVAGSGQLVNTLFQNNLVDELRILLYPVVIGTGKRLFKDGTKFGLKLISSDTFETGLVLLTYQPAKS